MLITVAMGFVIGIILGSFVKATADRLMTEESLGGRSRCSHCKEALAWYDLLPLLSYLLLSGKCRYCHKKIPLDVFLTEIILGFVTAGLFWMYVTPNINYINLIFQLFILAVISIVFIVDLKTGYIFDKITYPAIIIAGIYILLSQSYLAFACGLGFAGLFYLLIVITRGKGMGFGDVKYVFFLGLALGFPNSIVTVMLAFLIGAIFSLFLIVFGKKHFGQTVPFGPFLSLGTLITLFWGTQMIVWYIAFMR